VCVCFAQCSGPSLKALIGYLVRPETIETNSLLNQAAANNGMAGAELAVQDDNTYRQVHNQSLSLEMIKLADEADRATPATPLADRGLSFVLSRRGTRVLISLIPSKPLADRQHASEPIANSLKCRLKIGFVLPSHNYRLSSSTFLAMIWRLARSRLAVAHRS
jgi:hypothetical protein